MNMMKKYTILKARSLWFSRLSNSEPIGASIWVGVTLVVYEALSTGAATGWADYSWTTVGASVISVTVPATWSTIILGSA